MTAVLEKRPAKAKRQATPVQCPPSPAIAEEAALFRATGGLLSAAAATDEPHGHSGDSDRLLNIASLLAFDAAKGRFTSDCAFDIAACINAARLVPGDTESPERTQLIAQASQHLGLISETPVEGLIFTDVPRPTRKPSATPSKQFSQDQLNELHWQAFVHMTCARDVLRHYAEHVDNVAVLAIRDLLGLYLREAEQRIDGEKVGDLISGDLPDLSVDLEKILALVGRLAIVKDDGVLHAAALLLESAKRIVDGDLGILG